MKKTAVILLAVFLLCMPCMTAHAVETSADSTVITAAVPSEHKVTFVIHNGKIENNGVIVGDTAYYERQSVQNYTLIPDKDDTLERVLYNSEDVTAQVRNGIFTAPPVIADSVLEVFFGRAEPSVSMPESSAPVPTGDSTDTGLFSVWLTVLGSAMVITAAVGRKKFDSEDTMKKSTTELPQKNGRTIVLDFIAEIGYNNEKYSQKRSDNMKKSIFIPFLAVVLMISVIGALAGCSHSAESSVDSVVSVPAAATLEGQWKAEQMSDYIYTFNADGTGKYDMAGNVLELEYTTTEDGRITISFLAEGYSPVTLSYELDGDKLNIKDSFGNDTFYERVK